MTRRVFETRRVFFPLRPIRLPSRLLLWLQTAVLLLLFSLSLLSLRQKSPTFDEQSYLTRGLSYLRGENRHMRVGHPLGLNAWNALWLVNDTTVHLPVDDPSWALTSFHRPSELFMWEIGHDVEHIMLVGRLPTVWLFMLLAAIGARWAQALSGKRLAGTVTILLIGFDPNLMANGRLTTTDLGLAFGAALAGWLLWRFFKTPSWGNIALAAIGFAILQNTKFTAGLFVPLFTLVILAGLFYQWHTARATFFKTFGQLLIGYPLIAFVALWGMYGFQIGTLPDSLPTMQQLSGMTLPLAHHLEQLLDIGGRLTKSTPAFLLGNYSDNGWWYYFPIAFALKTPLPTLILLLIAFGLLLRRVIARRETAVSLFDTAALLIPALGYFAIALTTEINLGYRHLLPILPFLAVWIGREVTREERKERLKDEGRNQKYPQLTTRHSKLAAHSLQLTAYSLLLWLIIINITTFPHYLTFFNVVGGGAENGWRELVDSNIDWGQDLALLKPWMDGHDVETVWLSYFGEAQPDYYGINYIGLDGFPPRLMHPDRRPFLPHNPIAGIYAISATTLQGVHFDNHQQYAYFWDKPVLDKLGYSIFLYEVAPYGDPIELVLDGVQPDELTAVDQTTLSTNQITLHWLYGENGRYFTASENPLWVATRSPEKWSNNGQWETIAQHNGYSLLRLQERPFFALDNDQSWSNGDVSMQMGVTVLETAVDLQITTYMHHTGIQQPLKQFIHLTDADGSIIAQWDGLNVAWQSWSANDLLIQTVTLPLPQESNYQLWTGLYNPDDNQRWQTSNGNGRWDITPTPSENQDPIANSSLHPFTPSPLHRSPA